MRFFLAVLLFLALTMYAQAFSQSFAERCVYYSGQAYCDPDDYLNRQYIGPTENFVPTYRIYNLGDDTSGYVGYNPAYNEIVVAYRGSSSIRNWITNLEFLKTDYPHCGDCEVHKGFYSATMKVIDDVKTAVFELMSQHPSYSVTVTGHSLGAALATLTALELRQAGVTNLDMYHMGSPRVGNDEFAAWVSSLNDVNFRFVHSADIVPHVPPNSFGFHHIATEIWETEDGVEHTCNGSGEDENCSWSVDAKDYNVDDHMIYLGIPLSCDAKTLRYD